ncbi:MAG: hypothetical protein KGJ78_03550 [Alphaproteobacteria bacterium]|nr:hypothetical protein [Alphaproteobacteria bacterium]
MRGRGLWAVLLAVVLLALSASSPGLAEQTPQGKYKNFRTAIYVTVNSTHALADPATFARQYDRMARQLKFDKVYIEVYRDHDFATDAEIETVKKAFEGKGILVAGGVTLAAGGNKGQFGTFDYENPTDRDECKRASKLAAKHFNEVILDDFFFYTSKSDADIAAKGMRSWTQYRLDTMREAAQNLVVGPAKAVNPAVKMIIKYPNWYEHFQGLGYDLEKEPRIFDGIYTGTETRDPYVTDQLLQQYESYEIIRYFDNIRPGGNGGGWVDTYSTHYVDRYAEQLWDTLFAKAPQIMLFNWSDLVRDESTEPGERTAWKNVPTTFNWNAMARSYRSTGKGDAGPGWGSAAGYSLDAVDKVLGELGKPIGIPSYKPYQSAGEDFLQNYLGNVGIPIEMVPEFPKNAKLILLTEQAKYDPDIVQKIENQLKSGGDVVITSGLLRALQDKGIKDVVEWEDTGRILSIHDFVNGFGAGNGVSLNDPKHPNPAVLFPAIRFYTNDSWGIIRGVAGSKGNPILLMNRYSKGVIYLLTIPENEADLYNLPQPVLTQLKTYLMEGFPVRLDAPALVTMFAYDNDTVVVESYRPESSRATVIVPGENVKLRDVQNGALIAGHKPPMPPIPARYRRYYQPPRETLFPVSIAPHSWRVYRIER